MSFWHLTAPEDSLAIIDANNGQCFSYQALNNLVECFKQKISTFKNKALGIILCRNNIDSVIAYLAGLRAKQAVFLLDANLNSELLKKLFELYQPDWILLPNTIEISNLYYSYQKNFLDSHLYFSNLQTGSAIHPDLALLLSTSGTTGSPKVVRLSYKNLAANAESIAQYLALVQADRPITSLPMQYSYGLSVINSHLQVGATLVLTAEDIASRGFWDHAMKYKVTSLAGVPYSYQIFKQLRIENLDIPTLTTLTQAGGRLPRQLVEHFSNIAIAKNWQFYIMYGQTEATARISYASLSTLKQKPDSIGKAIPQGTLSIDPDTSELIYEGPNVMLGYAENRDDLASGDELYGRLQTGDLARKDKDGHFYITGRSKRIIKLFGLRINLDEVEDILESQYKTSVASSGVDEKLYIFVENNTQLNLIKYWLSEHLNLHPSAICMTYIEKIPRGERGKPDYAKLQIMVRYSSGS
jgi:acyl-CoA synthetase (AMP-forming)/AMP-acid ligase II